MHVTTVHGRFDIRIFHKECISLARAGYQVTLLVGDGLGDEAKSGVRIVDIGRSSAGRIARMREQPRRVFARIAQENPDLVHVHDPELLPVAWRLAATGARVVYDAHEDVPRQILTKHWLPRSVRPFVSQAFEVFENAAVRRLTGVVAATPHIRNRFLLIQPRTVDVCNFPFVDELARSPVGEHSGRQRAACYVGSITRTRGALELVAAMAMLPDVRLILCGGFEDAALEAEMRKHPGWRQVEYRGFLDRDGVAAVMREASVGLVTLQPMPSYLDSLPIKMFEYMSAGLPVVASDFPLWFDIVVPNRCGVCVNPLDPAAIADAVRTILDAPQTGEQMGRSGRCAVLEQYNWPRAEQNLLEFYAALLR
ncbi:glycosyltransferase family 4 protein [Piscinibacter sp.]|uniref:glycosyltransferase family 4 protein n=1 Tax=Piscinibacter sp. TaxID=1903157 RepID=UPI0025D08FCC|nr:glycosyltransferase family 4 protein [Piscinibacter sp.]